MATVKTAERAHGVIADMVWWLKGFAAARPPSIDEGDGAHLKLRDDLGEVRQWLARIEQGKTRRIGDEQAIVLTYAEFEVIYDGLRREVGLEERLAARDVVVKVLKEYQREQIDARTCNELPF